MAKALNFLHSKGIYHMNVTPDDILYSNWKDQHFVLSGFDRASRKTPDSVDMNTKVAYRAPETHTKTATTAADIWSLGVVALDVLLALPTPDPGIFNVDKLRESGWYETISEVAKYSGMPGLDKMLKMDPSERVTAEEIIRAQEQNSSPLRQIPISPELEFNFVKLQAGDADDSLIRKFLASDQPKNDKLLVRRPEGQLCSWLPRVKMSFQPPKAGEAGHLTLDFSTMKTSLEPEKKRDPPPQSRPEPTAPGAAAATITEVDRVMTEIGIRPTSESPREKGKKEVSQPQEKKSGEGFKTTSRNGSSSSIAASRSVRSGSARSGASSASEIDDLAMAMKLSKMEKAEALPLMPGERQAMSGRPSGHPTPGRLVPTKTLDAREDPVTAAKAAASRALKGLDPVVRTSPFRVISRRYLKPPRGPPPPGLGFSPRSAPKSSFRVISRRYLPQPAYRTPPRNPPPPGLLVAKGTVRVLQRPRPTLQPIIPTASSARDSSFPPLGTNPSAIPGVPVATSIPRNPPASSRSQHIPKMSYLSAVSGRHERQGGRPQQDTRPPLPPQIEEALGYIEGYLQRSSLQSAAVLRHAAQFEHSHESILQQASNVRAWEAETTPNNLGTTPHMAEPGSQRAPLPSEVAEALEIIQKHSNRDPQATAALIRASRSQRHHGSILKKAQEIRDRWPDLRNPGPSSSRPAPSARPAARSYARRPSSSSRLRHDAPPFFPKDWRPDPPAIARQEEARASSKETAQVRASEE